MEQINLNLIPNGILAVCHVSQYDNTGRKIRFHLFNGSDTYALSGTETITLRIRKTNGEILIFDIPNTASDYIDLTVLQQMTDVSGDSVCEFRLTDSGLDIGSFNFKMKIEPDAFDGNLSISEVSGNIATFKTDLAEDLIKLDVDLEPIQDLHGYDYPWPTGMINQITVNRTKGDAGAYGPNVTRDWDYTKYYVGFSYNNYYAENMLTSYSVGNDIVSVTQSRNAYGVAFPIRAKPNHQYYVGCTFGGTVRLAVSYFDSTGSLINHESNIRTSRIITTPDNCSTLVLVVYDGAASGVSVSASNIFINDPATETSYTPYSNICPITGHDSAQLVRTGKNLIDTAKLLQQSSNVVVIGQNSAYSNHELFLKKGSYTIRVNTSVVASVYYHDGTSVRVGATNTNLTFTLSEDTWISFYIYTSAGISVSNITDYRLELGSVATNYEPYSSDPTPITVNFGQTVYKGVLYSKLRKVLVTHVCETFDGSEDEDWISTTTSSVRYGFRTYFQHNKKPTAQSIDEMLSSVIPLKKSSESSSADDDIITCRSTTYLYNIFYIFAPPSKISTVEELRAFLANEPETVMYPLNEPFYIDLSQEQTEDVEKAAVASFETNIQRPLETSEHYFSCSQAEGTPTPDSPIPITGVSEITAYRTGKNLTNIAELPYTLHWGTDAPELVSFLNTLPIGIYTISNKYKINELPGNNKVQHGRFYITALIDGSQTPVLSYSVVTDTSPTVGKIYEESGTFEITASNKGKFNHAYRYCDQDTTHTGNDRGSYTCYDVQLEKASSATPYEPYSGESITVSLGGTYYGGKLVQSEDGSRKIILSHTIGVYDGSNDEIWNDYSTGNGFFISGINDHITESYGDGLCNILPVVHSLSQLGVVFGINSKYIFLMQVKTQWNISTTNELRAFLANNPIEIVYKLETPIEIDLPDGDPLTTLAGENNVYCNTGDTALTYYFNMVADPIRIPALVGTNNVYSDAGDVDVEYYTTVEGGND